MTFEVVGLQGSGVRVLFTANRAHHLLIFLDVFEILRLDIAVHKLRVPLQVVLV
jgi:hypothetical protein